MTLAEIGKRSDLTPEQAKQMAQLAVELAPLYGSGESLVQLITGRSSVTGEETSRFWAAVGVVPVAGGVLKKVGEPAGDALTAIFKRSDAAKDVPLLLNGPIKTTEDGMAHVVERHTVNDVAKFASKSKFNEDEDLLTLINSGTQQRMVQQANGNFARTWDVGRPIGIDRVTGEQTSVMTVITRQNGEFVTAFPGRP